MAERVVITGLGCVTPLGVLPEFWEGLTAGRSGIGALTAIDAAPYETRIAGQVRDFDPHQFMGRREAASMSRCVQFGVAAGKMALEHAGLVPDGIERERVGIYLGTSIGPLGHAMEQHAVFLEKGIARVHPMAPAQNYPGVLASELAILLGLNGPAITISTACTSGADAVGLALAQIRAGVVDVALAGGSEAPIFPMLFASFDRLGLMSRKNENPAAACRPFDLGRDGFALSEGAAVCVLESETYARSRGASLLAELAGFGASCDAYHHLQQDPSGRQAARAIESALRDAGAGVEDIGYISAHGTGTRANDTFETAVIKQVFGKRAYDVPMSSIKSMCGHLMGACGALELVACVKTLTDGVVPPTANLAMPDPDCDLDYVPNNARAASIGTILSNTFGFGSRNAALVVRAF